MITHLFNFLSGSANMNWDRVKEKEEAQLIAIEPKVIQATNAITASRLTRKQAINLISQDRKTQYEPVIDRLTLLKQQTTTGRTKTKLILADWDQRTQSVHHVDQLIQRWIEAVTTLDDSLAVTIASLAREIKQMEDDLIQDSKEERKRNNIDNHHNNHHTEIPGKIKRELKSRYQLLKAIVSMGPYFCSRHIAPASRRPLMELLLSPKYLDSNTDIIKPDDPAADTAETNLALMDALGYVKAVTKRFSKLGAGGVRAAIRDENHRMASSWAHLVPSTDGDPRQLSREEQMEAIWEFHLVQEACDYSAADDEQLMEYMRAATEAPENAWNAKTFDCYTLREYYEKSRDVAALMDRKRKAQSPNGSDKRVCHAIYTWDLFNNTNNGQYTPNNNKESGDESDRDTTDYDNAAKPKDAKIINTQYVPKFNQYCSPRYGGCGKDSNVYWHKMDCPKLELDQDLKAKTKDHYLNNTNIDDNNTDTNNDSSSVTIEHNAGSQ